MLLRDRRLEDEPRLLEIARLVHLQDRYPLYLPDADYRSFLLGHETLGAWVAEEEHTVIGQVALHPRTSAPAMELAARALSQSPNRLGVVARLLVHPDHRRLGAGAELLARAAEHAVAMGLFPILDVVQDLAPAILMYEQRGWLRLGEVTVTFGDDVTIQEYVYVAPPTLRPAP